MNVLSKRFLLLLTVLFPNHDPLYFSVQSGKCMLPDPGVNVSLGLLPPSAVVAMCMVSFSFTFWIASVMIVRLALRYYTLFTCTLRH